MSPRTVRARAPLALIAAWLASICLAGVPPAKTNAAGADAPAANEDTAPSKQLRAGRFGTVLVYLPVGTPRSVALFVSGDGGWHLGVIKMARALAARGAVVIGIDINHYLARLHPPAPGQNAPCRSLAADFERLSHRVQRELGMPEYHVPVLVGYSSGATVAYATLAQSPPGTFAGALSLGFCIDQDFRGAQLCTGAGLHVRHGKQDDLILAPDRNLQQPWIALQGQQDQVCAPRPVDAFGAQIPNARVIRLPKVGHGFAVERNWLPQYLQAYQELVDRSEAPRGARPPQIGDLPVNEVRAAGNSAAFALLLTGDGGWAGLDRELAGRLAVNGIATVGFNSLKYFWTQRTPEQTANDIARVIRHYLDTWHKTRVLLVGYSFGADVLPFVVNRLPADLKASIASVSLLGFDASASFEVSIADWIGSEEAGAATRPEVAKLAGLRVLCIYGKGEKDTVCPSLASTQVRAEQVGTGHHFGGHYDQLADRILAYARSPKGMT